MITHKKFDKPADCVRRSALQENAFCASKEVVVVVVKVAETNGRRSVVVVANEHVARRELLEMLTTERRQVDLRHVLQPLLHVADCFELLNYKANESILQRCSFTKKQLNHRPLNEDRLKH